eukprot:403342128
MIKTDNQTQDLQAIQNHQHKQIQQQQHQKSNSGIQNTIPHREKKSMFSNLNSPTYGLSQSNTQSNLAYQNLQNNLSNLQNNGQFNPQMFQQLLSLQQQNPINLNTGQINHQQYHTNPAIDHNNFNLQSQMLGNTNLIQMQMFGSAQQSRNNISPKDQLDYLNFNTSQFPSYSQVMGAQTPQDLKCDCLEKLRLKVEQELDRLRGEFRRKEVELLGPMMTKYDQIDSKIEGFKNQILVRVNEYEQGMMMQEQTIGLIINSIQTINNMVTYQSSSTLGGAGINGSQNNILSQLGTNPVSMESDSIERRLDQAQRNESNKNLYDYPKQMAQQLERATQISQQVLRETKESMQRFEQQNLRFSGQDYPLSSNQVIPASSNVIILNQGINEQANEEDDDYITEGSTPPSDDLSLNDSPVNNGNNLRFESDKNLVQIMNGVQTQSPLRIDDSNFKRSSLGSPLFYNQMDTFNRTQQIAQNNADLSTKNFQSQNRSSKRMAMMKSNIFSHLYPQNVISSNNQLLIEEMNSLSGKKQNQNPLMQLKNQDQKPKVAQNFDTQRVQQQSNIESITLNQHYKVNKTQRVTNAQYVTSSVIELQNHDKNAGSFQGSMMNNKKYYDSIRPNQQTINDNVKNESKQQYASPQNMILLDGEKLSPLRQVKTKQKSKIQVYGANRPELKKDKELSKSQISIGQQNDLNNSQLILQQNILLSTQQRIQMFNESLNLNAQQVTLNNHIKKEGHSQLSNKDKHYIGDGSHSAYENSQIMNQSQVNNKSLVNSQIYSNVEHQQQQKFVDKQNKYEIQHQYVDDSNLEDLQQLQQNIQDGYVDDNSQDLGVLAQEESYLDEERPLSQNQNYYQEQHLVVAPILQSQIEPIWELQKQYQNDKQNQLITLQENLNDLQENSFNDNDDQQQFYEEENDQQFEEEQYQQDQQQNDLSYGIEDPNMMNEYQQQQQQYDNDNSQFDEEEQEEQYDDGQHDDISDNYQEEQQQEYYQEDQNDQVDDQEQYDNNYEAYPDIINNGNNSIQEQYEQEDDEEEDNNNLDVEDQHYEEEQHNNHEFDDDYEIDQEQQQEQQFLQLQGLDAQQIELQYQQYQQELLQQQQQQYQYNNQNFQQNQGNSHKNDLQIAFENSQRRESYETKKLQFQRRQL